MKGRAEILMILLVLMSLLAVPAGASSGNEYIMNVTIQEDTIRFADHASAIDGNWIKLSGSGEEIQLPYPLTFTYNGVSSTSLTVHGEQIDVDLNVEEFVDHTIYYPYLTHPVYVNDSVQNRVIMDFDGAAYFANSEVELHLIEASISELYAALYELINGGEISPLFNIASDSQYWEVQLDAQGDLSMDLGYLPAGDYIILITYPDESVFLSVSAFMVLESACQVTAVDTGDELLLNVQLLNIPEQAEHIYEAVLIKTSEYRAEMYMEFDGTKDGIALSLNDVPIMDGPSFVGFTLADPKASDIREKLNDMIGEERIAMAYGPGPDLSLPIHSMEPGDYLLLTLVRDNANVLAFSQSEISLDGFQLSNAVVLPDTAVRGENITVSVDLNNPRDVERYEVIGLNASWMPAGQTIDQVFVLGPGDSGTIDFDIMVPQNADLGTASIIVAGNRSSVSLNVTVAEPMPVASFTVNETSGFAPMSIELIDGSVNSVANVWDLGDGTVVQDMSTLVHTYGLPGVYNVTLTVFNVENVPDSSSKLISVGLKVPPIQVPSIPKGASNASKKDLVNDLSVPPSFVNSIGVWAYEYIVTAKNDTSPANVSVNISLKAPVGVTNITDIGNGTLPDFYYSVSIDDENWYEDISEIQLRIYYDRDRVNALGIDENTLRPVRFTNGEWVRLNTPGTLADGTELFASGVVTAGDDPYVWANISRFSNYGVAGQILSPATPEPEEDSDRSSNRVGASAVSIEPSENVILRESQSNAIWKDVPVRFEFKDTPVSSISFIPRINVGNSNMIVETLKEPSKLTERAPPGIVFEHLNIWTPHQFKNEFFENIVVEFAIDKAWLMENEAEPESIKLLRYTHEWKSLPTTFLREDADMVYYQAVIPGFSAFTIVADVDGEMMVEGYELKADFIAVPLKGQSPLEVSFEDRSHNAVSWYWDLGDGTSSTEQNPVHTYEEPGIYTVTLKVSNVDGSETLAISREINVVDDDTGIPGFEIAFAIVSLLAVAALFRRKKEI